MMTLEKLIEQSPGPVSVWADGETELVEDGEGNLVWEPVSLPEWFTLAVLAGATVNIQPDNIRLVAQQTGVSLPPVIAIVWDSRWPNVVPLSVWGVGEVDDWKLNLVGEWALWYNGWNNGAPEVVLA